MLEVCGECVPAPRSPVSQAGAITPAPAVLPLLCCSAQLMCFHALAAQPAWNGGWRNSQAGMHWVKWCLALACNMRWGLSGRTAPGEIRCMQKRPQYLSAQGLYRNVSRHLHRLYGIILGKLTIVIKAPVALPCQLQPWCMLEIRVSRPWLLL